MMQANIIFVCTRYVSSSRDCCEIMSPRQTLEPWSPPCCCSKPIGYRPTYIHSSGEQSTSSSIRRVTAVTVFLMHRGIRIMPKLLAPTCGDIHSERTITSRSHCSLAGNSAIDGDSSRSSSTTFLAAAVDLYPSLVSTRRCQPIVTCAGLQSRKAWQRSGCPKGTALEFKILSRPDTKCSQEVRGLQTIDTTY